jgi:hypothetical protein
LKTPTAALFDYFIEVSAPHSALVAAAKGWDREISAFPVR